MTQRLTLAQQLAQFEDTAPADFDPEDRQFTGIEDEDIPLDKEDGREHYLDVGPSDLRNLQDSISDPKYESKRTSRKRLQEESESEVSSDNEEDVEEGARDSGIASEDHPDESESSANAEADDVPLPVGGHEVQDDLAISLRKTREDDRTKGRAVTRQIAIWNSLLDARIRLQKSVSSANRLPPPSSISDFMSDESSREALDNMLHEAMSLSDDLFDLQEAFMRTNDVIQPPPRKRRRTEDSDYAKQVVDETAAASALSHTFHPYLIQTLSKWSSKIQAVAPSVLLASNRNAFSKASHSAQLKSAVQLIDEMTGPGNATKLLCRTRIFRGKGIRLGVLTTSLDGGTTNEELEDIDTYDDTDFYQQLLRDVIDARGGGGAAAGEAREWLIAQKQRKSKKTVDTRASKGRKLRYEVHEKLQNFMVPVPTRGAWHDEQVDELFASLLGKGFEDVGLPMTEGGEELLVNAEDGIKEGFRIFG